MKLPGYARALRQPKRYKVLAGGRGSAKSYTIARELLCCGAKQKERILCGREFQNSITESVHKLLCEQAEEIGLSDFYKATQHSIVGRNGTEFFFKGVRLNVASIKSMVGITKLWLEEAHTISQASWDVLIPTVREPNSEIWVSFNPETEEDPTYKMFFDSEGNALDREDAIIIKANWQDNPWFPDVLLKEKDHLYKVNPDLADHVWGGNVRRNSDAQIFRHKWRVDRFEINPEWDGPYYGADWGFSVDPTCLVKVYIAGRKLYVRNCRFGFGTEIDQIPALFDQVEDSRRYKIRADCARPETISYVSRMGFHIEAAEKWSGSVEDGIEFLRSFDEIIIHPDCEADYKGRKYGLITEAKNYSFKTDRLTQDVLTDIVDAYNHGFDAIRYALEPLITKETSILDVL